MSGQVSYLLDTNVLSETRKLKADPGVMEFLATVDDASLLISVLTIGELRKGIASIKLRDPASGAARRLMEWVDGLEDGFADRILAIDAATATLWGDWSARRPRPVVDTLLAATAVRHNLTLVTRNMRDLEGIPVSAFNPWQE